MSKHWSEIEEVGGSVWHFRFMLWVVCHLPLFLVEFCTAVICFFFWIGAAPVRARSKIYLEHLRKLGVRVGAFGTYKHILSFALSMVEKLLGWKGAIKLNQIESQSDDLQKLVSQMNQGQGAFLLCSHLGNVEMLRSLTEYGEFHTSRKFQVFPVVDLSGSKKFNALLRELNPELMENVIDANSMDVDSAIWMKEKIAGGNLVVIAGDRTSSHTRSRVLETKFLGETANFPEGAFSLAGILNAPVYFVFAIRKHDFNIRSAYEMHVVRAKTSLDCSRKERPERLKKLLQEYTGLLERLCKEHPYQWYNFYNFWEN
ncbi:lipid A biosynthesis acyltransferase [Fibrobacter sp. UBA4297]|uniref:LpxL/LpxP family acyltransferase n=1 Tax=Fibrobacter sp. UBA4297 TaxID=1946536 RepID=UPI0025BC7B63|nr:lipid A biosynthesis acyltransferase [Fibrobacter sp. UBA4297]